MKLTSYSQAVASLESLQNLPIPQYMKDPAACAAYLKRLKWLLDQLDNPEKHLRFIHVAGTSGKGSVTVMLHEILRAAGYRVGSYYSPYVSAITERFRFDNKLIHPDDFVAATNIVLPEVERAITECPHGATSFFETLVAIALVYFKQKKCDWVVLETGCGGDFDATNIISAPVLAIITSIGLDHTEILGNTKSIIAKRKAGIFKKGSTAIIGEEDPHVARELKRYAEKAHAKKIIACESIAEKDIRADKRGTSFNYNNRAWHTRMTGTFQAHNARIAIEAARALHIDTASIELGLAEARLPGRFEIMQESPVIILDGAHNHDKINGLADTLAALYRGRPLSFLVAATNNTGKLEMFTTLFRRATRIAITRFTTNHRPALDPKMLYDKAKKINPKAEKKLFLHPHDGLQWLMRKAKENEIIIVTGSLFLIGDVRGRWMPEEKIITKQKSFV